MKDGNEAAARVVDAFDKLGINYLLAGSYSSNYYGIPRATRDADFVAVLSKGVTPLAGELGSEFELDPQPSFESVTGTMRDIFAIPALQFKIEIFHLSNDAHDQSRFERRKKVFDELIAREVFIPSAEDVIITKLRWAVRAKRSKDADDIRDVIAVQGNALDWEYVHRWTAEHGTRKLLDEIRASIPPLD
tara:strand:- start:60 stop:629 length:570 start_codon:yes stop_codon:yes gene_type:complete